MRRNVGGRDFGAKRRDARLGGDSLRFQTAELGLGNGEVGGEGRAARGCRHRGPRVRSTRGAVVDHCLH